MKKIITIASAIISLVIIGVAIYFIYNSIQSNKSNEPDIETLATPVISYDESSSILSWNQIENATSYVVSINGIEETTEELKYDVFINDKATEMKVKAKTTKGYYDSEWSNTYTYTVTEKDTQKTIRVVISDFLGNEAKLKEIVSVDVKNNSSIRPKVIVERNGLEYIEVLRFNFDETFSNLSSALQNIESSSSQKISSTQTVKYDTLSEIIKQEKYGYDIEDYVNQGYEVCVVNSATAKFDNEDDKAYYSVYGLLKLTKGMEIKYVDVSYSVETQKELYEYSYINFISDDSKTSIDVSYANELSGDAYDFAKELEAEKNAKK